LSAQFNFATPRKIYKTSTAMLQGAGDISVIKVHARLNPRGRQSVAVRRLNCVLPRSAATPRRANGRRAHIRRLRPDGEKRTVASPPHQLARPAQSLIVDDVERKQRPPPPELGVEPLKTCAAFHGGEVNETIAREVCFPTCSRTSPPAFGSHQGAVSVRKRRICRGYPERLKIVQYLVVTWWS
jgi:hypothetical protein